MGKASRLFQFLLGIRKREPSSASSDQPHPRPSKRKWSFVKSNRQSRRENGSGCFVVKAGLGIHDVPLSLAATPPCDDHFKRAVAVAAATAAVAEAAVAAASAAAAVVKLTGSSRSVVGCDVESASSVAGSGSVGIDNEWAVVKIQSHFRAYLARRALRALKALVKLQALVRGHIVRKQTTEALQSLQALLRAQARARAGRARVSDCSHSTMMKPSSFHYPRNGSIKSCRALSHQQKEPIDPRWFDCKRDGLHEQCVTSCINGFMNDAKGDQILEIDAENHLRSSKRRTRSQNCHRSLSYDHHSQRLTTLKETMGHQAIPSAVSYDAQSLNPSCQNDEQSAICSAYDSPQFYSASSKGGSSKKGLFTPTRSECLSGYSDHPNYMSFTESAKAKMRSLSAPRVRPQFERSNSANKGPVRGCDVLRCNTQRTSTSHDIVSRKAYPGTGYLDRHGIPIHGDEVGFADGPWIRCSQSFRYFSAVDQPC